MSYSLDSVQDDCYENSAVLINKLGITDEKILNEVEEAIFALNSIDIETNLKFENVNFEYYKTIHKMLFDDLYGWAGKVRVINLSKKGTSFCDYKKIEKIGINCFKRLGENNYFTNLTFADFIDEFTELYCDLNDLHPFREGNGRVQRLFLTKLAKNAGFDINFSKVDTDLLMIATIKSVSGDIFMLKDILSNIITITK